MKLLQVYESYYIEKGSAVSGTGTVNQAFEA